LTRDSITDHEYAIGTLFAVWFWERKPMPTNERTTPENSVDNASAGGSKESEPYQPSSASAETTHDTSKTSAVLNATRAHPHEVVDELRARVDAKVESAQATADDAKRALDPRRLLKEHPVASAAIALGAIGVGVVGYRFVRRSLLVRIYLAVRFGRLRELFPA
jgi:hypothetical protein